MIFYIVAAVVLAKLGVELWLGWLNRREVRRHVEMPKGLEGVMDAETFLRAKEYTLARSQFGVTGDVFGAVVLLVFLGSGVLPWVFGLLSGLGGALGGAVAIVVCVILMGAVELPLEWWEQFRLEARFGFNKSSVGLWVGDKLKGMVIGVVIGVGLLWLLLAVVGWAGKFWWAAGFGVLFGFQVVMMVVYPKVVLPLFNKLVPLPEGELKERLMALGERTGFRASAIEVMDGSKRSGHSNAFFTGFGKWRRVVLFDTLVGQLEPVELEAVLAHEVGHYRSGHIPKRLALMAAVELGVFWAIDFLAGSGWFNAGFGFASGEMAPTFLLVGMLGGVVGFWFGPLGNWMSRKDEYEADEFARKAMGGREALVGALRKLSEKNLSNLTPHRWFSGFYYSHPTLLEREARLKESDGKAGAV